MMDYKNNQAKQVYQDKLVQALVEQAEMQYPSAMVKDTLDDMVEESDSRLQREHKISLEDALQLDGRTMDQYRDELREQAELRIKRMLVLSEFAKQENVEVSDDDVVKSYADLLASAGLQDQATFDNLQLDSPIAQSLRSNAFSQKVMERLEKIGRGEGDLEDEPPAETEESADDSEQAPVEPDAESVDAPESAEEEAVAKTDESVEEETVAEESEDESEDEADED
jgi:trigger factor